MTSKLSVYVGAYFEIAVNLQEYPTGWLLCVNGHKHWGGQYCPDCGQGLNPEWRDGYPESVLGLKLPSEFDDELCDTTPPDLCGRGTIIAAGNLGERDGGEWVRHSGDRNLSIAALPSYEDAARMAAALMADYAEVYQALLASPAVSTVRVAVGIVPYLD